MRLACTAAESAFRLPAIAGKAGRYISTANGPISESRPSTMAARTIWAFITTLLLEVDKPSVGRSDDILGFFAARTDTRGQTPWRPDGLSLCESSVGSLPSDHRGDRISATTDGAIPDRAWLRCAMSAFSTVPCTQAAYTS